MGISKKVLLLFLLFQIAGLSILLAQGTQSGYLEAKRLFNNKDYRAAYGAFSSLEDDPTFATYARFYCGLSQLYTEDLRGARNTLNELLQYYPDWEHNREVLFWLAKISLELGQVREGLEYIDAYEIRTTSSDIADQLIPAYLADSSVASLTLYYKSFSDNKALASLLARKIDKQTIIERDQNLFEQILSRHQLNPEIFMDSDLENVFKESYNVAVVMPFMFESLDNPGNILRNSLITDFYQGMQLAVEEMKEDSIFLNLVPFDTKRSEEVTRSIVPGIVKNDVIVGPLLPPQVAIVKEASSKERINMINPLSSNDDYLEDNEYAFLFRSSYLTMARELAEYVVNYDSSDNAAIYFSPNPRDSIFAEIYRSVLEAGGITIADFRSLDELAAKVLLDSLTDQYEQIIPKAMADSILEAELPGRFPKFRGLKLDEEENLSDYPVIDSLWFSEVDEEGKLVNPEDPRKMVAYEMKFRVPKDSIGSFTVITRSNTIANNIISAAAAREDSTRIYGYGDWFDFKVINFGLMDRLQVTLAMPEYLNSRSLRFDQVRLRLMRAYSTVPSEYHFHGYEFARFLGKALKDNGKYFQNGFYQGKISGYLSEGVDYKGSNNNQIVPIVRMRNFEVAPVERDPDEY